MVEITPRAEQHLLQLRSERGFDQQSGARFEANEQRVRLTFSTAPASRDRVIEGADLPIFVAPEVIDKLEHATIDVDSSDGKTRLMIRRSRRASQTARQSPAG